MNTLLQLTREKYRGPIRDRYGVFEEHYEHHARIDGTWPYVCIQIDEPHGPRWYRHFADPTLVMVIEMDTPLAVNIYHTIDHPVRDQYPYLFPQSTLYDETETAALENAIPGRWDAFVLKGVHDLLRRQLSKLDAYARGCMLVELLSIVETLSNDGTRIPHWELGVLFDGAVPRLKLLRLDGIQTEIPRERRDALRQEAMRSLLPIWHRASDRDLASVQRTIHWLPRQPAITRDVLLKAQVEIETALRATGLPRSAYV